MRGLVRRRVRAKPDEGVELTIVESRVWPQFVAAADETPPVAPPLPTADEVMQRAPIDDEWALRWSAAQVVKHFFAVHGRGDAGAPAVQAVPAAALVPPPQAAANKDTAASADEYDDRDLVSGQDTSGSDDDDSGTSNEETDQADADAGSGDSVGDVTYDGGSGMELEGAAAEVEETGVADISPSATVLPSNGASALNVTVPPARRSPSSSSSASGSDSSASSSSPPPTRRRRGTAGAACARRPIRRSRRRSATSVGSDAWRL